MWESVKKAIGDNGKFLLCTHRDPDADGIGSELALWRALEQMGKQCVVLNPDSLPAALDFLDPGGVVRGFDKTGPEESCRLLDETEVIFFLDASQWGRLRPMDGEVMARAGKVLCIDHHPADEALTPGSVIRDSYSSTGELVYDLLKDLGHPLDGAIAFSLYTALVKDTGSFRFENTAGPVFRMATELSAFDEVRPNYVYGLLFERSSIAGVKALGKVLNTLGLAYDNRLAHISLTAEIMEQTGATLEETETFVDVIRALDPVELCIYFRELDGGRIKVSFRSKSAGINVNTLAEKFGGGGHLRASGAVIEGALEVVVARVVEAAAECFENRAEV
ncbi:MAG: bifunctional oligoribonuclease/PAP phosphatase NrnA [Candidatus Glassbacteria bacterium]|nr:bifunctional oligoribonuclease/PAP phosphatase NrnA [Candidatus Glassbacteria bacterium]